MCSVHRFVLHNSEIRDARDPLLSPGQVGFLNGWGVFSTLRISDGVPFAFERHYARMRHDAELLRVPVDFAPEVLLRLLQSLIEANNAVDAVLRVAIVRNRGGLFEAAALTRDCDLVAFTAELTNWGEGVHLTYVPNARFSASPFAGTKITSWAQNLAWYEKAHQEGFDEAILLNEHGLVSECTSANIFAVQGRQVFTPPLATSGCLPGITRAILLDEIQVDEIQVAGVDLSERDLSPSQLEASDLVFVTSTTRDLIPVLTVDGFALKQERAVFQRLRKAFTAYRTAHVANFALEKTFVSS